MATGPRKPRIIAGEAGGRRLAVPAGDAVRPTSDRVKESVFAALGPGRLVGARVLDLYAGSGALGLEALSRGASAAVLVERERSRIRGRRAIRPGSSRQLVHLTGRILGRAVRLAFRSSHRISTSAVAGAWVG